MGLNLGRLKGQSVVVRVDPTKLVGSDPIELLITVTKVLKPCSKCNTNIRYACGTTHLEFEGQSVFEIDRLEKIAGLNLEAKE